MGNYIVLCVSDSFTPGSQSLVEVAVGGDLQLFLELRVLLVVVFVVLDRLPSSICKSYVRVIFFVYFHVLQLITCTIIMLF